MCKSLVRANQCRIKLFGAGIQRKNPPFVTGVLLSYLPGEHATVTVTNVRKKNGPADLCTTAGMNIEACEVSGVLEADFVPGTILNTEPPLPGGLARSSLFIPVHSIARTLQVTWNGASTVLVTVLGAETEQAQLFACCEAQREFLSSAEGLSLLTADVLSPDKNLSRESSLSLFQLALQYAYHCDTVGSLLREFDLAKFVLHNVIESSDVRAVNRSLLILRALAFIDVALFHAQQAALGKVIVENTVNVRTHAVRTPLARRVFHLLTPCTGLWCTV